MNAESFGDQGRCARTFFASAGFGGVLVKTTTADANQNDSVLLVFGRSATVRSGTTGAPEGHLGLRDARELRFSESSEKPHGHDLVEMRGDVGNDLSELLRLHNYLV